MVDIVMIMKQEESNVKEYQTPDIYFASVAEDDIVRTSGLTLNDEGNIGSMDGIDFSIW